VEGAEGPGGEEPEGMDDDEDEDLALEGGFLAGAVGAEGGAGAGAEGGAGGGLGLFFVDVDVGDTWRCLAWSWRSLPGPECPQIFCALGRTRTRGGLGRRRRSEVEDDVGGTSAPPVAKQVRPWDFISTAPRGVKQGRGASRVRRGRMAVVRIVKWWTGGAAMPFREGLHVGEGGVAGVGEVGEDGEGAGAEGV